jgi:preprotein translocase subunit Sec63
MQLDSQRAQPEGVASGSVCGIDLRTSEETIPIEAIESSANKPNDLEDDEDFEESAADNDDPSTDEDHALHDDPVNKPTV